MEKDIFKWDRRYLELAAYIANWSKDPSTKVGAVIVRSDNTVASVGYNGFPRGVIDHEEHYNDRDIKYSKIIHAEVNAILNAKEPLAQCTLYTYPFPFVCVDCAKQIIQVGISAVVVPRFEIPKRWEFSSGLAADMFMEAHVDFTQIEVDKEGLLPK